MKYKQTFKSLFHLDLLHFISISFHIIKLITIVCCYLALFLVQRPATTLKSNRVLTENQRKLANLLKQNKKFNQMPHKKFHQSLQTVEDPYLFVESGDVSLTFSNNIYVWHLFLVYHLEI